MKKQIALLISLEENEISVLEKLTKGELQQLQEQAASSIQNGLIKLGLVESKTLVKLEESDEHEEIVPFYFA